MENWRNFWLRKKILWIIWNRNEQSRRNKKKLIQINNNAINDKVSNQSGLEALNETDDIGNQKKNKIKTKTDNNQGENKKKKKHEPGCECIII